MDLDLNSLTRNLQSRNIFSRNGEFTASSPIMESKNRVGLKKEGQIKAATSLPKYQSNTISKKTRD